MKEIWTQLAWAILKTANSEGCFLVSPFVELSTQDGIACVTSQSGKQFKFKLSKKSFLEDVQVVNNLTAWLESEHRNIV